MVTRHGRASRFVSPGHQYRGDLHYPAGIHMHSYGAYIMMLMWHGYPRDMPLKCPSGRQWITRWCGSLWSNKLSHALQCPEPNDSPDFNSASSLSSLGYFFSFFGFSLFLPVISAVWVMCKRSVLSLQRLGSLLSFSSHLQPRSGSAFLSQIILQRKIAAKIKTTKID